MAGNDMYFGAGGGIHCCLDCKERHSGCHAECEKYISEKAALREKARARIKEKNDAAKVDEVLFRRWR